jgi:hypothetical protein
LFIGIFQRSVLAGQYSGWCSFASGCKWTQVGRMSNVV